MDRYNPLQAPDPTAWLALTEDERTELVEAYHEADPPRTDPGGVRLHVMIHVIVENQIAEGDALPVREKARQLVTQGLDRHDAIHAIGSVLAHHMVNVARGRITEPDPNARYFSALRRLTARKWLQSG